MMDSYFFTFLCILIIQMSTVLVFLNPDNDVRKITLYLNDMFTKHRSCCVTSIALYFALVLYLGMYTPLMGVLKLISSNKYNENEKRIIVSNVQKIYMMAGFSLFLFIISRGIRALTSYAAKLLDSIKLRTKIDRQTKHNKGYVTESINILPSLLKIKRPIYENDISFGEGVKDQLNNILKRAKLSKNGLSSTNMRQERASLYS